jgi:predicted nucleotidyltransferase component of viral defense system
LGILKELMAEDLFRNFVLVGGTSLALQIGHRKSIDIDMFGNCGLNELEITAFLNQLGQVKILRKSKSILIYSVNGIKVDFVKYPYPLIKLPLEEDNFRLATKEDIAAMKLNAIAGRGSKKDFIDLYFLLQEFTLQELFEFFRSKYSDGSDFLVLKSLTFFDDAESDEMPYMVKELEWEKVKSFIIKKVKNLPLY